MPMTTIFAHRGASMYAPENTFAAFELALQMGAEGIETDVQLTKDQVPILIHDEKINRTTNSRGFVKNFTLQQLKRLDAGSWFSRKYKDSNLVTLEEFLCWAKSNSLLINLELKNSRIFYKHLETIVFEMLKHFRMLERTVISSFNTKSLLHLNPFQNQVEIALLVTRRTRNPIQKAKMLPVHALHVHYSALKSSLVQKAKRANIPLRVFTVNRKRQWIRCFTHHCDAIFTDVPDQGLKFRRFFQGGFT